MNINRTCEICGAVINAAMEFVDAAVKTHHALHHAKAADPLPLLVRSREMFMVALDGKGVIKKEELISLHNEISDLLKLPHYAAKEIINHETLDNSAGADGGKALSDAQIASAAQSGS